MTNTPTPATERLRNKERGTADLGFATITADGRVDLCWTRPWTAYRPRIVGLDPKTNRIGPENPSRIAQGSHHISTCTFSSTRNYSRALQGDKIILTYP
jgi:hypothetical protein